MRQGPCASVAYLGLGSNLGDRAAMITEALARLESKGERPIALSPLYETEPWGVVDQPRFINAVCAVATHRAPHELLAVLQGIELAMGRQRTVRNGPRTIDLDILMYDAIEMATEMLQIPHPGMLSRATVLVPLCDIAPSLVHPVTRKTIREHLLQLGEITGVAHYPPGLLEAAARYP